MSSLSSASSEIYGAVDPAQRLTSHLTAPENKAANHGASRFAGPVDQDRLNRHNEPILEPELAIVDPHRHLWTHNGNVYLLPDTAAEKTALAAAHVYGVPFS